MELVIANTADPFFHTGNLDRERLALTFFQPGPWLCNRSKEYPVCNNIWWLHQDWEKSWETASKEVVSTRLGALRRSVDFSGYSESIFAAKKSINCHLNY